MLFATLGSWMVAQRMGPDWRSLNLTPQVGTRSSFPLQRDHHAKLGWSFNAKIITTGVYCLVLLGDRLSSPRRNDSF